jgi:hypothetical protein
MALGPLVSLTLESPLSAEAVRVIRRTPHLRAVYVSGIEQVCAMLSPADSAPVSPLEEINNWMTLSDSDESRDQQRAPPQVAGS